MKSRDKGKRLEYTVRDLFRRHIDPKCERQVMSGADVWNKGDIRFSFDTGFRFSIECKNQENAKVWEWWKQAVDQCGEFEKPLVVFSRAHHDVMAMLRFEDLLELMEEVYDWRKQAEMEKENACEHNKEGWRLREAMKHIKAFIKES